MFELELPPKARCPTEPGEPAYAVSMPSTKMETVCGQALARRKLEWTSGHPRQGHALMGSSAVPHPQSLASSSLSHQCIVFLGSGMPHNSFHLNPNNGAPTQRS